MMGYIVGKFYFLPSFLLLSFFHATVTGFQFVWHIMFWGFFFFAFTERFLCFTGVYFRGSEDIKNCYLLWSFVEIDIFLSGTCAQWLNTGHLSTLFHLKSQLKCLITITSLVELVFLDCTPCQPLFLYQGWIITKFLYLFPFSQLA